jgi:hypothetical protein
MKQTRYPSYNIMDEQEAWDRHTREIVRTRLIRQFNYRFLTLEEAEVLRSWCSLLMDDSRAEVIQYVLCHIDETLSRADGEGQRKPGVPEAGTLVRGGLKALDQTVSRRFQRPFFQISTAEQKEVMTQISKNQAVPSGIWTVPQKEWFNKLLTLTIEAYYSHPKIWSEMGYGGPAYPRGYIRADIGMTDPWEAKQEHD